MELVISLFGVVIFGAGAFGLLRPSEIASLLTGASSQSVFNFAIGARLVAGVLFIAVAPATRMPDVATVFGGLFIGAALVLPLLGRDRFARVLQWMADLPEPVLRLWALMAMAMGGFLIYLGL